MQVLLDNMAATIIGGVIFLMLIAVNMSNRESLTDTTAFYAMVRQQEEFAKILTLDLQGVEELHDVAENTADSTFRFRTFIENDPNPHEIVYKRQFVRQKDGLRYHRIVRYVDGQRVGGSADMITTWKVQARDAAGADVGDPDAARQIFVHFDVASLLGRKTNNEARFKPTVEQTYWEAAFFPPLLQ